MYGSIKNNKNLEQNSFIIVNPEQNSLIIVNYWIINNDFQSIAKKIE
jgi:hypothetical protein